MTGRIGEALAMIEVVRILRARLLFSIEPLAKFIDRVIFPPLEGASLSPSVKPEPA
jgi:hypothetical protein